MNLLVTGSRNGHPRTEAILGAWVALHGVPNLVVLGDARGVDTQAYEWVRFVTANVLVLRADWDRHGKKAGMLRNREMVDAAGRGAHALAFPVGESRGTRNCIDLCQRAGLFVAVFEG